MKNWYVSHGNDGFSVVVEEAPWWAYAVERTFERLDTLTGCRLCGARLGDWAWKVPLGRPRYEVEDDGERWLANSLAGGFYNFFSKVVSLPLSRSTVNAWVKVDDALGEKLRGDADRYWLDEDDE